MNFLFCLRKTMFLCSIVGLLTFGLIVGASQAAAWTWDGGGGDGNPALDYATNWSTDAAPPFTNAADTYTFREPAPRRRSWCKPE